MPISSTYREPEARTLPVSGQVFCQHESTLRLGLEALGIPNYPGKAATAPSMSEFFQ
jgi:hypothetical protein